MPSDRSESEVEQRRIEVVVKSTRIGNLATYSDESGGSGVRAMTDAEIEADDFISEITKEIDAEAHESGDLVAEVLVEPDGECSVEWADDAVRLAADGGQSEAEIHQITFDRDSLTEQHIRDAQNADDFPVEVLHEVVLDPTEITVEGTPEGIRWLYDYLHYLKREWRAEGEQWDADAAEDMAKSVWEQTDGELPDQQRNRRVR